MRILFATCEFLWFVSGDSALPSRTQQAIQDPGNEVFLSVVSFWEIIIKHALGKLPLPQPPDVYIPAQRVLHGVTALDLDEAAVAHLALKLLLAEPARNGNLPLDRLGAAKAMFPAA